MTRRPSYIFIFLETKKKFEGWGNVESHHPGGILLGEMDPDGAHGIKPDEVDPG